MARKLAWSRADFGEAVAGYMADLASHGAILDTAFATTVQERISFDIWYSLTSPNTQSNYGFLFYHRYVKLLARLEVANVGGAPSRGQLRMYRYLAGLISASRKGGMRTIADMARFEVGPPFALEGMTLLGKAMSEITHEMIGTLVALPYFDVLKAKALAA